MKKVIIDCDLVIRKAQVKSGAVYQVIDRCLKGEFQPIISQLILKDCVKALGESDINPETQALLEDFFAISEIIKADFDIVEIKMDKYCHKYIQCALAGQADYLLTINKSLLSLQKYYRTEIITPKDFLLAVK